MFLNDLRQWTGFWNRIFFGYQGSFLRIFIFDASTWFPVLIRGDPYPHFRECWATFVQDIFRLEASLLPKKPFWDNFGHYRAQKVFEKGLTLSMMWYWGQRSSMLILGRFEDDLGKFWQLWPQMISAKNNKKKNSCHSMTWASLQVKTFVQDNIIGHIFIQNWCLTKCTRKAFPIW